MDEFLFRQQKQRKKYLIITTEKKNLIVNIKQSYYKL